MPVQAVYETHATTVDNENGIATGWLPGELSAAGRDNARELGRRRRDDGLELVITSDPARAVETVEIAFTGADVPVITDSRLREVDYGDLNGARVDVVHRQRRERVDTPFPGGQSYREATEAVSRLLDELLLDELLRDRAGQRVLLVGHVATRVALDNLLAGRPLEAAVTRPFAWREGWTYELSDERPVVRRLDGRQAAASAAELTEVYRAAFCAPGYDQSEEAVVHFRGEQLATHTARDGFRCVTVRLGEQLAGFGYGYTGERGQWWSDKVAELAPQTLVGEWLGGHFELVELAVDPRWQGRGLATALHDALLLDLPQDRGLATALHDALLLDLPQDRALLTTYRDDRPAPRLYRRLGWTLLHEGVFDESDLWGLVLRLDGPP